jgi:hypothetical protein
VQLQQHLRGLRCSGQSLLREQHLYCSRHRLRQFSTLRGLRRRRRDLLSGQYLHKWVLR